MALYCSRYERTKDQFVKVSCQLIEKVLPVLQGSEIKVLLFLAQSERKDKVARTSSSFIAKGLEMSPTSVKKALKTLRDIELVDRTEDGYRLLTQNYEDFLEKDSVQKLYQQRRYKKCTDPGTKTVPEVVQKVTTTQEGDQKVRHTPSFRSTQEEEEEGGPAAAGACLGLSSSPSASPENHAEVISLPWVEQPIQKDHISMQILEDLNAERNIASALYSPSLTCLDNPDIDYSLYLPMYRLPAEGLQPYDEQALARTVFLQATNHMIRIQTRHYGFEAPSVPLTPSEVKKLGIVVSSLVASPKHGYRWEERFVDFLHWIYRNKDNWPLNFLPNYFTDYAASAANRNRKGKAV